MKIDLSSKFGMMEMEVAAEVIIRKCLERGHLEWVSPDDFDNSDGYALDGFIELIHYGWLIHHDHYKACYIPKDSFIDRVQPYLPLEWKGTQDVEFPSQEPDEEDE